MSDPEPRRFQMTEMARALDETLAETLPDASEDRRAEIVRRFVDSYAKIGEHLPDP